MDALLNFTVFFFGSGLAFFVGMGAILAALGLALCGPAGWARVLRNLSLAVGGLLIALSATPLPLYLYFGLGLLSVAWLISEPASAESASAGCKFRTPTSRAGR